MIKAACIASYTNNNCEIVEYALIDNNGNVTMIHKDKLLYAMMNSEIEVDNLKYRKVYNKDEYEIIFKTLNDIDVSIYENFINKAKLLGDTKRVYEYKNKLGQSYYELWFGNNCKYMTIYIPDNVTELNQDIAVCSFTRNIYNFTGYLRIVGGKGLKNTMAMFRNLHLMGLDLSLFDMSNVEDARMMFYEFSGYNKSNINIQFGNNDMASLKNAESMFDCAMLFELNLSKWNVSNLSETSDMFHFCNAKRIDLRSFKNFKGIKPMFDGIKCDDLIISNKKAYVNFKTAFLRSRVNIRVVKEN